MIKLITEPIDVIDTVAAVLNHPDCSAGWTYFAKPRAEFLGTRFAHMVSGGVATCHALTRGQETGGFLLALYVPCLLTGVNQALEYLWMVLPEHRKGGEALDLLTVFEHEARMRGCKCIITGNSAFVKPAAMRRLYLKRGYVPHAEAFRKDL